MSDMPESTPPVTLADILRKLDAVEGLRETRRRDLRSAVRSVRALPGVTPPTSSWMCRACTQS